MALNLPPDDQVLFRRYLHLQVEALEKSQRDRSYRDQVLGMASGPTRWVGVLVVIAIVVATYWHRELWSTFTPGSVYGTGPDIASIPLPGFRIETLGPLLGALAGVLPIAVGSRGVLSRLIVVSLISVAMLALLVDAQLSEYFLTGAWYPIVLVVTIGAFTFVLQRIAVIGAGEPWALHLPDERILTEGSAPGRWLSALRSRVDPCTSRGTWTGFCVVPAALITVHAVHINNQDSLSLWYASRVALVTFALWTAWAVWVAPARLRLVLVVLLPWLIIGYLGWHAPAIVVPGYFFVLACAGCVAGLTVVGVTEEARARQAATAPDPASAGRPSPAGTV